MFLYIPNIPVGVTITISTTYFDQNQHTLYEQFYQVTNSFDTKLGSSSGHDTLI